jgi:hypothetical protein
MGGTQIRFSRCLLSLEGRCALATMYNKFPIWGYRQAVKKYRTYQVFDAAFAPPFPVRGLQCSVWF